MAGIANMLAAQDRARAEATAKKLARMMECEPADFIKGLIGQAPPSGKLFEVELPAGEARFSVTGCGIGFQLDEVAAIALRDVIEHGIRHCQKIHLSERGGVSGT